MQYGASVSRELPGAVNLTVGYTGSRGKDMFLRGVANTLDFNTRTRQQPTYGQIDYKTSGCLDGLVINNQAITGAAARPTTRCSSSATRRFRAGFTGGVHYQYSQNKGTTQGSNEAATSQNTFDYNTEYGTNPQDIPHTFNGSLVYLIPGEGAERRLARGWHRERAQRRTHQRHHQPGRQRHGERRDGDEHSGRQQPGHAASGCGSWCGPVPEGRRAVAQSGRLHDAAAGHVRQPRRATRCAGPSSCSST